MSAWKRAISLLGLAACATLAAGSDTPVDRGVIEITYERYVLPNGLTVIVHEDHKAPVVSVNVWYHVGSKDERPGRTGFAHLFEHLMFNGSQHFNDDFIRPLEAAGATKINGSTWLDRTNYFQNVPISALDRVLWLESDRMGYMIQAINQEKLDEQRGVVQNEKRQGENRPYGKVDALISSSTYPEGHPYSWETIGSMADLNAASLDDVSEWFRTWYGAANAVLSIAGDVNTDEVKKKVEHYFGDIPSGPELRRQTEWIAKMTGSRRATIEDRVPQARIYKVWNVPGYRTHDFAMLKLAGKVLGDGRNSRLYQRLVYRDQIATDVSVWVGPFEIGSQFQIDAMVSPGTDPAAVERALDEEMMTFLRDGPRAAEIERVKSVSYGEFVRAIERIDGFGGKSAILAQNEVLAGNAAFYKQRLAWDREATAKDVHAKSRQWLADGVFVLNVTPSPEYQLAASGADRSKLPETGIPSDLHLPPLQRTTLSNGLEVIVAERHDAPIVQFTMLFDAGYAADSLAKPGYGKLTMNMLLEGTRTRNALEIAAQSDALGAKIETGNAVDYSFTELSALTERLEESVELFSDVVRNPTFPEAELSRQKLLQIAAIQQEKATPRGIVFRLLPRLVYGEKHAYADSLSGDGNETSVGAATSADIRKFYGHFIRPDNGTLLIVGDVKPANVLPLLEKRFGDWQKPTESPPVKNLAHVAPPANVRVFLINRPGAEQSTITAARVASPRSAPDYAALTTTNAILGGNFVSRLNLNLREDKGWTYGVVSGLTEREGEGLFYVNVDVQTDKTVESMVEILRELRDISTSRIPKSEEIKFAKDSLTLTLPGNNETVDELAESYTSLIAFGLRDSYWNDFVDEVQELTSDQVQEAAAKLVNPDQLTWVVIGDLESIEIPIRSARIGDVEVLDADGNKLR